MSEDYLQTNANDLYASFFCQPITEDKKFQNQESEVNLLIRQQIGYSNCQWKMEQYFRLYTVTKIKIYLNCHWLLVKITCKKGKKIYSFKKIDVQLIYNAEILVSDV